MITPPSPAALLTKNFKIDRILFALNDINGTYSYWGREGVVTYFSWGGL